MTALLHVPMETFSPFFARAHTSRRKSTERDSTNTSSNNNKNYHNNSYSNNSCSNKSFLGDGGGRAYGGGQTACPPPPPPRTTPTPPLPLPGYMQIVVGTASIHFIPSTEDKRVPVPAVAVRYVCAYLLT